MVHYLLASRSSSSPQPDQRTLFHCIAASSDTAFGAAVTRRMRAREFLTRAIGSLSIDIAELRTEQSQLYLSVAIDRTSKFASSHPIRMRRCSEIVQAVYD